MNEELRPYDCKVVKIYEWRTAIWATNKEEAERIADTTLHPNYFDQPKDVKIECSEFGGGKQ